MKINIEINTKAFGLYKIIALINKEEVGYLYIIEKEKFLISNDVFVKKEFRRKKIATNLYDFAMNFFKKEIIPNEEYYTETFSSEDAIMFWRSRGKFLISNSKIYD